MRSRVIRFNGAKFVKNSTTTQGFINWGNKPEGIIDGLVVGAVIDAGSADNVVNFRMYGNHTRPRIRDMVLLNSDFYAFGIGALVTPGDKSDVIDSLDIDGLTIESERGSSALGADYSMGIEFFPGVNCKNWKIRNVRTFGKIINKIHSVDGLTLENVRCKASSAFNPLSSGYFEVNNCKDVTVDEKCFFDGANEETYFSFLVSGERVAGGLPVTGFKFSGTVKGMMGVRKVEDITLTSSANIGRLDFYGVCDVIRVNGSVINRLTNTAFLTGSLNILELNGATIKRNIRIDGSANQVASVIINGGILNIPSTDYRFHSAVNVQINGSTMKLSGSPQSFALWAKGAGKSVTLSKVVWIGDGWDRPLYATDSASLKVVSNVFDGFASSTLVASGSEPLALNVGNIVNGAPV